MTPETNFLIESEGHINAAINHLIGSCAVLNGNGELCSRERSAALLLADDALDEVKALLEKFESAWTDRRNNQIEN